MKKISYLFLMISVLGFFSCSDSNTDVLTGNKDEGGLLTVKNALVGYVVGNGDDYEYKTSISAFQGDVKVVSVDVYKQFTSVDGASSQKALLATYTVPTNSQLVNLDLAFTYPQLISGLSVNGTPLSSDDASLSIGDSWTLTYVTTTDDGDVQENAKTTKVSVGTRFAGDYYVIQCDYWRIGVIRPDVTGPFLGTKVTIESVNATTYRKLEYAGPFNGNEFYFTIDPSDVVNVPTTYNGEVQLLNALPAINCTENPGDMTNACSVAGLQNVVTRDDVEGKDRIYMTYGYLAATGSREFYEVLEKVVE
jgi:hypothetical protein